jgi:hypothetical protein
MLFRNWYAIIRSRYPNAPAVRKEESIKIFHDVIGYREPFSLPRFMYIIIAGYAESVAHMTDDVIGEGHIFNDCPGIVSILISHRKNNCRPRQQSVADLACSMSMRCRFGISHQRRRKIIWRILLTWYWLYIDFLLISFGFAGACREQKAAS